MRWKHWHLDGGGQDANGVRLLAYKSCGFSDPAGCQRASEAWLRLFESAGPQTLGSVKFGLRCFVALDMASVNGCLERVQTHMFFKGAEGNDVKGLRSKFGFCSGTRRSTSGW